MREINENINFNQVDPHKSTTSEQHNHDHHTSFSTTKSPQPTHAEDSEGKIGDF